jgi:hypothetical protein
LRQRSLDWERIDLNERESDRDRSATGIKNVTANEPYFQGALSARAYCVANDAEIAVVQKRIEEHVAPEVAELDFASVDLDERGGSLVSMSGTSMATPHVAGVAALWTQKLFPDGARRNGWAKDVQRALEVNVFVPPGAARNDRNDIGLGVVQAPQ